MPTSVISLPAWLTITPATTFPCYRLVRAEYIAAEDPRSNGSTNTYLKVLNKDGNPVAGMKVWQDWTDDRASEITKLNGDSFLGETWGATFYKSGDSHFDPTKGQVGAYTYYLDAPCDRIGKAGLPLNRHVQEVLVWQWFDTPTPPPPPPSDDGWVTLFQNDHIRLQQK